MCAYIFTNGHWEHTHMTDRRSSINDCLQISLRCSQNHSTHPFHTILNCNKENEKQQNLFVFSIIKIFCAKARLQFVGRLRFIWKGNYDLAEWLHRLTMIGRNILWQTNVFSFCGMKSTIYNKKWITIFQLHDNLTLTLVRSSIYWLTLSQETAQYLHRTILLDSFSVFFLKQPLPCFVPLRRSFFGLRFANFFQSPSF